MNEDESYQISAESSKSLIRSTNYIKKDATTIHFPLSLSKGNKAKVNYTYR